MKQTIVEFGKDIFTRYYNKDITLSELMDAIEAYKPDTNGFDVLGCYCEDDMEVTVQLYQMRNKIFVDGLYVDHINGTSLKVIGYILMTCLSNRDIPLDNHFKCDTFFKATVDLWKSTWKNDFHKILEIIDAVNWISSDSLNAIKKLKEYLNERTE